MRKLLFTIVALLTVVSMLTACGTAQNTSAQSTTAQSTATTQTTAPAPTTAKKIKLQWISPGNIQDFPSGITANDNFIINAWKEKSGYDIDVVVLPLDGESDKLNLMFNSGEATGIAWVRATNIVSNLVTQKLIVPLDDFVSTSPAFIKYASMQKAGQYEGHQYALVPPEDGASSQGIPLLVRADILMKNGMETPPKTYDDFKKALQIFKDNGMTAYVATGGVEGRGFNVFQSLYTIQNDRAIRDDKVVLPKLESEAKDYLKFMNWLYTGGYIPKDYDVLKDQDAIQLYESGKAGMISFAWPWSAKTIIEQSEKLGFKTQFLDFPNNINGDRGYCQPIQAGAPWYGVISAKCEDPKAAMAFIDFLTTDEEIHTLTYFGKQGENYDVVNGIKVPNAGTKNIAWDVYYQTMIDSNDWYALFGVGAGLTEYYYPSERNSVGSPDVDPFRYILIPSDVSQKISDLTTQVLAPYYNNVTKGTASVDDFDKMVQSFMNGGGQDAIASLQKLWEAAGKPKDVVKSWLPENHPEYTEKYIWK